MQVRGGLLRGSIGEMLEDMATGTMHWLSERGDHRVTWNARDNDEVEAARRTFNDLRAKGFMAYAVDPEDGSKREVIREFDPSAQKVILSPPMAGGA